MFELVMTGEKSGYIESPAKIGLYLASDREAYLIDSGGDKDAGRRVRKLLDQQGWTLRGIVNTHSNADHIGGNRYLQQNTGCRIFAPGIEAAFTRSPILEPSFLYGGYPFAELRHKFLMAQESEASDLTDPDFPKELEVLPLPGHFFDMSGYRTPDGTVFLADCVSSPEVLEKYRISFIYDVAAYLSTLDAVEAMEAKMFVPSHAAASADVRELVRLNRAKVLEVAEAVEGLCGEPMGFDQLLKAVFDRFSLTMSCEQYVLIGSTLRSYLSWLKDGGRLTLEFSENRLLWRRA